MVLAPSQNLAFGKVLSVAKATSTTRLCRVVRDVPQVARFK
jgi:hypothetical protein